MKRIWRKTNRYTNFKLRQHQHEESCIPFYTYGLCQKKHVWWFIYRFVWITIVWTKNKIIIINGTYIFFTTPMIFAPQNIFPEVKATTFVKTWTSDPSTTKFLRSFHLTERFQLMIPDPLPFKEMLKFHENQQQFLFEIMKSMTIFFCCRSFSRILCSNSVDIDPWKLTWNSKFTQCTGEPSSKSPFLGSSCSFSRVYWVYTHFRSIWIVASLTALLYLDSLEDFDARSSRLRLLPTSFLLQNNQQKQPKNLHESH